MPGLNIYQDELEQLTLTATDSPQQSDMIRGVLSTGIELQVSLDVSISGGTTNGTLLTETPHNILEWVMLERDGDEFVERIPGRMLAVLQRYIEGRPPRFTTFVDGAVQANTILQATYFIPFALPWLVNPFESVGYFAPVGRTFKVWVKRIQTVNYATFFSGGDRALTLNSATVRIFQSFAKQPVSYRPTLLPRYSVEDSDAIASSQTNFRVPLQSDNGKRIAGVIVGALRDGVGVANIVNNYTLESDRTRIVDVVPPATLTRREERFYPGIDASAGSTEASTHQARPVGYNIFNFVTDHVGSRYGMGRARMSVNARRAEGYRYTVDVTRTSGTELLRLLKVELESVPGWTKL